MKNSKPGVEIVGYTSFFSKEECEQIKTVIENNNETGATFWLGLIFGRAKTEYITDEETIII